MQDTASCPLEAGGTPGPKRPLQEEAKVDWRNVAKPAAAPFLTPRGGSLATTRVLSDWVKLAASVKGAAVFPGPEYRGTSEAAKLKAAACGSGCCCCCRLTFQSLRPPSRPHRRKGLPCSGGSWPGQKAPAEVSHKGNRYKGAVPGEPKAGRRILSPARGLQAEAPFVALLAFSARQKNGHREPQASLLTPGWPAEQAADGGERPPFPISEQAWRGGRRWPLGRAGKGQGRAGCRAASSRAAPIIPGLRRGPFTLERDGAEDAGAGDKGSCDMDLTPTEVYLVSTGPTTISRPNPL